MGGEGRGAEGREGGGKGVASPWLVRSSAFSGAPTVGRNAREVGVMTGSETQAQRQRGVGEAC